MTVGPVVRHVALLTLLMMAAAACYVTGFRKGFVLLAVLGGVLEFVFWVRFFSRRAAVTRLSAFCCNPLRAWALSTLFK